MSAEKPALQGRLMRCHGWQQEASQRMLANTIALEASRGFDPSDAGAAQRRDCYPAIAQTLEQLGNGETAMIHNGVPESIFLTHISEPRVLVVGPAPMLESHGSLAHTEQLGLILHGEMAAGNWMLTSSEEMLLGAYAVFESAARRHFGGSLSGRLVVSGGFGRIGGVLPLAATLQGAAFLGVEVDAGRIKERVRAGYCDYCVNSLDEALRILKIAVRQKQAISVGLEGNCAEIIPELASRGVLPDLLTDQTGKVGPATGYVPSGLSAETASRLKSSAPQEFERLCRASAARQMAAMLELQKLGAKVFEYGYGSAETTPEHFGIKDAAVIPDLVSAYLAPLMREEGAPIRWAALSGDSGDIHRIDTMAAEMFSEDTLTGRWIRCRRKHLRFQGLPARAGWMRKDVQAEFGMRINDLVRHGKLKAPVVLGREESGESLRKPSAGDHGISDANASTTSALLAVANGASWISIQKDNDGGVVAVGRAVVASGEAPMDERIARVFGAPPE
ncbi:MAG: urocanate hydratase [Acidobacteriota bacterium]|nr:urocanate hydratase [Acidobacteriota bacterium]